MVFYLISPHKLIPFLSQEHLLTDPRFALLKCPPCSKFSGTFPTVERTKTPMLNLLSRQFAHPDDHGSSEQVRGTLPSFGISDYLAPWLTLLWWLILET